VQHQSVTKEIQHKLTAALASNR